MSGRNKVGAQPLWAARRYADDLTQAGKALDDTIAEKSPSRRKQLSTPC
jgi:hypothetical protein